MAPKFLTIFSGKGSKIPLLRGTGESTSEELAVPRNIYPLPSKETNMSNLVEQHTPHTPFAYISVIPADDRTKLSILSRLAARSPPTKTQPQAIEDLPILNLNKRQHEVNFRETFTDRTLRSMKDWVNLHSMDIFIGGSVGQFQEHGNVVVQLIDNRNSQNPIAKTFSFGENVRSQFSFSLDYCIHKNDIGMLSLRIANPNSSLHDGVVWGSMRVELSYVESNEAMHFNVQPVTGQIQIPLSLTAKFKENPNSANYTIPPGAVAGLRMLRKNGELFNFNAAVGNQVAINDFEGSVAGSEGSYDVKEYQDDAPEPEYKSKKGKGKMQDRAEYELHQERLRNDELTRQMIEMRRMVEVLQIANSGAAQQSTGGETIMVKTKEGGELKVLIKDVEDLTSDADLEAHLTDKMTDEEILERKRQIEEAKKIHQEETPTEHSVQSNHVAFAPPKVTRRSG